MAAIHQGYKRSIRKVYPDVWTQDNMINCLHLATTHMITLLFRLKHKGYRKLVLSPQALTNNGGRTITAIQTCLTNQRYVLRNIHHQPYLRMPVPRLESRCPKAERFTIRRLVTYNEREEMIRALVRNFGYGGESYPMTGTISTSRLDVSSSNKREMRKFKNM